MITVYEQRGIEKGKVHSAERLDALLLAVLDAKSLEDLWVRRLSSSSRHTERPLA